MTFKSNSFIQSIIGGTLFVVVSLIIYNYICRSFYQGAPGFDGPLLSYLMYRNPGEPTFAPHYGGGAYYQTHLSIVFSFLSSLSHILPFSRIEYFGFIQGVFVGLSSLIVYLFLYKYYAPAKDLKWSIICGVIGLVFGLNSITLQVIYYHHFEAWIPILIITFLYCWHEKKYILAYSSFVLLLSIREDAGFHYFGLIFLTLAYTYFKHKNIDKRLACLAIVAFIYSVLGLWIQRRFYPGDIAFARMYIDFNQTDPFGHVTAKELLFRLKKLLIRCAYLSVPIILQLYYALLKEQRKHLHTLIALLSCVPWMLLSLISKAEYIYLLTYYSFPLIIIFFWPFFSYVYFENQSTLKRLRLSILKWQGAIIIISVLLAGDILVKICKINTTVNVENVKLFQQELIENKGKLGKLYATVGISGLDPNIENSYVSTNLNTVIYNVQSKWKCEDACNGPRLNHFYRIDETNIRIATTYDLTQLQLFSNLKADPNKVES